jgi:methanogenic corrinoid protein MtbC1
MMVRQKEVIEALERRELRTRMRVIVGGAPVTQAWAQRIEADGYHEDAVVAVHPVQTLMKEQHP